MERIEYPAQASVVLDVDPTAMNSITSPVEVASRPALEAKHGIGTNPVDQSIDMLCKLQRPPPTRTMQPPQAHPFDHHPGGDLHNFPIGGKTPREVGGHPLGSPGTSRLSPDHKKLPLAPRHAKNKTSKKVKNKVQFLQEIP